MRSSEQSGGDVLSLNGIAQALVLASNEPCSIESVAVTGSTNEDLAERARRQQPAGNVLRAAAFQTGGRGRQRRIWHAAPGAALLFSVAIPVSARPDSLPAVTLACGVALAECLAIRGVAVQLKWPNDVRVGGCKLAGILTELVADRDLRHALVIGIGMNLHLDDAARRAIGQPAVALDQLISAEAIGSREQWIGRLGGAVIAAVTQFMQDGFAPFRTRFNELLEAQGEMIEVLHAEPDNQVLTGRLIEIDPLGRLVIETGGHRRSISAGEISVRR